MKVHVVLLFNCGELDSVRVHASEENALRCATTYVAEWLTDDFIKSVAAVEADEPTIRTFAEKLKQLHAREAYADFAREWDTFIAEADYAGPVPRNFDIEVHEL